jgi:UDP-N-acetylmuramate--alanine ligase
MKKAFFIGIKGVGMTALAQLYQADGIEVSGSDVSEKFMTDEVLEKAGIQVYEDFRVEDVPAEIDEVVVSKAFYDPTKEITNPHVQEVLKRGIPTRNYSQALGEFSKRFTSIGVAGSHGKTTTTALLGQTLVSLGKNPHVVVGSFVPQFGGNAHVGGVETTFLVAENDEYQRHFLDFHPRAVIVLNIDFDHPDYYKDMDDYLSAFREYLEMLPMGGFAVVNGDDENVKKVIEMYEGDAKIITFGEEVWNDYRLKENTIECVDGTYALNLSIIGKHSRLNATAVFAFLHYLDMDVSQVLRGMKSFTGTKRRQELIGSLKNGAMVYDDYAHHPKEILATLQAFRETYPERQLRVIFQPHTYSRTASLKAEFAQALSEADEVLLLPIYGSKRETQGGAKSEEIVELMREKGYKSVTLFASQDDLLQEIQSREFDEHDVVLTMGAGDVWMVSQNMLQ